MRFLIVAALCATTATASADGLYFTDAYGGTKIGDELAEHTPGGFRVRLGVGARVAEHWAVDGWIAGAIPMELYDAPTFTTYGLDVKYINSLSEHFDLHLRGTVSRGHLSGASLDDYSGRGLGAGAGISAKGKVRALGFLFWPLFFTGIGPKVTAAVFVDSGYEFYRLHRRGDSSIDAQVTNLTLGFAVGSDF